MNPFAAIAFYPLVAVALAIAFLALRLGRRTRGALVALCVALSIWVAGLILLISGAPHAERILPFGMLLAGAFVHAGADVARVPARRAIFFAWAWGGFVAILGAIAPRLLYGPGARGLGPLFVPFAILSAIGTAATLVFLARLAREAKGTERRRRIALVVGCLAGALGGGGVIGLRVTGAADVELAAPLLLIAVVLAAYAVFRGEDARGREILAQGAIHALSTAAISAVGLVAFFFALPRLTPSEHPGWLVFVVFVAAIALDPLRMLVVEAISRRFFRRSIAVRDLTLAVEAGETRAEQAERLAQIGRVAGAVAHEIRNPLGVIAAECAILARTGGDPGSIAAIRAQIERARRFLDDLLRYGRPRPLEIREVDVAATIALAVSDARRARGERPVAVAAEGFVIEADPHALADVVRILVDNALIATNGRVTVRAILDREALRLSVEDDGPGVPKEIEAELFEPFVTGRGRDAKDPGTGLGLAIAARLVERHRGTIAHERPASGGARFVVRWPRCP